MTYTAGQKVRASQMTGYVCTSSTRPTGHSGQMIYETDTGMYAGYVGGAWRYLFATGEIGSDASFNAASNQTIGNAVDTVIAFGTDLVTSPLVVKGTTGAGHYFRLQRAGRWLATSTIRWASNATGERYNAILVGGSVRASQGALLAGTSPVTHNLTAAFRVAIGDQNTSAADVHMTAYQSSGANRDLEANSGSRWNSIQLSWLGP
jgi:hypothetical protein